MYIGRRGQRCHGDRTTQMLASLRLEIAAWTFCKPEYFVVDGVQRKKPPALILGSIQSPLGENVRFCFSGLLGPVNDFATSLQ